MANAVAKILGMGERIPRAEVRPLAGLASWMAGLIPQLNAFTRMLWAAVHASGDFTIPLRQVRTPLRWFAALADESFGPLERRCRRRAKHSVLITFDGSLSGGGATLQAGITQFNEAHRQQYISYWASEWTDDELRRIQVKRGDPAGQARVEALTLLHAVWTWSKVIREFAGSLAMMGDALGVLHDATKFRASAPILNSVMAEMALILAPMAHKLSAAINHSAHMQAHLLTFHLRRRRALLV